MKIEITQALLNQMIEEGTYKTKAQIISEAKRQTKQALQEYLDEEADGVPGVRFIVPDIEVEIVDELGKEDGQDISTQSE